MTTTIHADATRLDRLAARTLAGLAAFGLAVTILAAPFTVGLAHKAGEAGGGAGRVAFVNALLFAIVLAPTTWHRLVSDRRVMRVRPLIAAAAFVAVADVLAVQTAAQTIAGNARHAALGLGYTLWTLVLAGVLFGIAALPIADQDGRK